MNASWEGSWPSRARQRAPLLLALFALHVQRVGGKLADHEHAIIHDGGFKRQAGGSAPEHAAGNARAGWVPWKRPGADGADLNHPQPVFHIDPSGRSPSAVAGRRPLAPPEPRRLH